MFDQHGEKTVLFLKIFRRVAVNERTEEFGFGGGEFQYGNQPGNIGIGKVDAPADDIGKPTGRGCMHPGSPRTRVVERRTRGINDYSEYSRVFKRFFGICSPHLPQPFVFIGHSTGCAVGLEYLHETGERPFAAVLLLAPLVCGDLYHIPHYQTSRAEAEEAISAVTHIPWSL